MNNENKPLIAVTMGDPSGVGPEIVALALNADDLYEKARPVVIGSIPILTQAVELYDLDLDINEFKEDQQNDFGPGKINVIDSNFIEPEAVNIGDVQKQSGRASYLYIKRATELILEAKLDAMATAPIHKEALKLVGIPEAGCTEI
ncbi:MAG: 4-hydroxythreonine-4-phosphate dehydrogenase PdxA, partial [Candidatus Marinimicrobia bacterium]|nr:4-hydroxythreonine-4-phosphate dehydrogenase PdxA [Candidatus Neomarinimicrobiota bacterium]